HREQAGDDRVRIAVLQGDDFAVVVRLDAAHVVVHGRHHGDRLLAQVNAREDLRGLGDARQTLGQNFRRDVVEVQVDVVAFTAHAAAFADFHGHGAGDHVARGEVLRRGGVTLHEALAVGVGQVAAFAARALGDEHARAVNAGGVELHEFHVLQRQARADHHAAAVAGAGV